MKNILIILFIITIGIIMYGATLRGVYGNPDATGIITELNRATKPFELSPERGRYLLTLSLAENRSFSLNKQLAKAAMPDVGYYDGRYYVYFTPGISLLAWPFYTIGKTINLAQVFSFSLIAFFAIGNLLMIYAIGRTVFKLPRWSSLLAALIFGFASTSWSYAITFYQHHVTTFLILSSFLSVYLFREKRRYSWLYALYTWITYGIGIWIDYPNALLLFPIVIYLLLSMISLRSNINNYILGIRKSVFVTMMVFLIISGFHAVYNKTQFGDYFRTSGGLIGVKEIQESNLFDKKNSNDIISQEANQKKEIGFFKEEDFIHGLSVLFTGIDRSIFVYSPIFLLSFFGLYYLFKFKQVNISPLLAVIGVNIFLYSSWGDPWGGWAFGPRYLIPTAAILSLLVSYWLYHVRYRFIGNIITAALFILSCAVSLLGALTTNQVPPKIEADFLHMKYNFLLNLDYLTAGKSGSFYYNHFLSDKLPLANYFIILFSILLFIAFLLLFIFPIFEEKKYSTYANT